MTSYSIRPVKASERDTIALIAERMRLTLMEVVDEAKGAQMYTLPWLRERVRWHLDPSACVGAVFVAERSGDVAGHTIVRVEHDEVGTRFGLFSTTYVELGSRRLGIADELLGRGEAWMRDAGLTYFATQTARTNEPLIRLYEKRGYEVVLELPEHDMIRLGKRDS